MDHFSASFRKRIRLPLPVCWVGYAIVHTSDPALLEQTPQGAIQGAGTEDDPPLAEHLNFFHDGVAMFRGRGYAQKDKKGGFRQWGG
jgi:hypothetical protein